MKKLFVSMILISMATSFAGAGASRRPMDGHNFICNSSADRGNMGQRLSVLEQSEQDQKTTLKLKLEFLRCEGNAEVKLSALSDSQLAISQPVLILVAHETQVISQTELDLQSASQEVSVTVLTSSLSDLQGFVRILVDRGGKSYESFGAFRLTR